jgi:ParB family transcriptional regulator, chromosome partitioning protein
MSEGTQVHLQVSAITPQPGFNPRRYFDPAEQKGLEDSIRAQGVIQPIAVRPNPEEAGKYWLIAGESRWRAAGVVGLEQIPAIIHDVDDHTALVMATHENLRRSNLSVAEEALSARRVLDLENGDEDEAARKLGWTMSMFKARLALTHAIPDVMQTLAERRIKLGHAELLCMLTEKAQAATLKTILERNISVEVLRDQMTKITVPLATACFDKKGCEGCPFNSTTTLDLFEAHSPDAMCSNRACFNEKTEARLVELRDEKLKEFPVVFYDREKLQSSYTFLVERGKGGVGPEQYIACKGCKDFGLLLSTAPGKEGQEICNTTCFNLTCNKEKVKAFAATHTQDPEAEEEEQHEEISTAAGKGSKSKKPGGKAGKPTTKADKKKSKPTKKVKRRKSAKKAEAAATPTQVLDQYRAFACREASAFVSGSAHAQLVLSTWALLSKADDDDLEKEGFGGEYTETQDALAELWKKGDDALHSLSLRAMQSMLLKPTTALVDAKTRAAMRKKRVFPPAHVTGSWVRAANLLVRLGEVNVADRFMVDRALLESHTKSGLESLLTEAKFVPHYDEANKDKKGKDFKTLLNSKHPQIVDAVLGSGFSFKGFVPAALAKSLAGDED